MDRNTLKNRVTNTESQSRFIIGMVIGFIVFGVLMIYNVSVIESFAMFGSSNYFLLQQGQWAIISIVSLLIVSKIPTSFWLAIGPFVFIIALGLMIAVLVPGVAVSILGAKRWLSIGGFVLQPSEAMKFALVLYLATWLAKPRRFLSFLFLVVPIFGLVMLQPDLGSGLILLSISGGMYVVSGKPFKHILWMLGGGFVGILLLILLSPYRMNRLTTFLDPESDPLGKSYHIRQITIALGNGGLFGQGLGKSNQKYLYIPEATTDSVFAIIAEELGFFFCGIIIIGYIVLCTRMSAHIQPVQGNTTYYLIGVGVICWFTSQVLVNLSSVVALIPLTGVPLPFLSYGGSSLLALCTAIGILIGLKPTHQTTATQHAPTRAERKRHRLPFL